MRAGSDGRPRVTDGPARAGDVLAGYWVVDVKSEERALEIAARASACPGPGGKPGSDPVEVHPIAADPRQPEPQAGPGRAGPDLARLVPAGSGAVP
ncbi:YciI family protein [Streptomyces erythrochromogenes]|uniref:YciI family protein n=1 Tax=Streptomyces erythrochromogenes TaxID=285574 RepID=UPI00224CD1A8|nr:hypothetical protein [Streptomyces erythrochromogenes]MCX5588347.1 hypothetical protein [Streptomyces erythrochromogenes]